MSRKGCSPDNAACEGFFGRLKNEMFYPGDWQSGLASALLSRQVGPELVKGWLDQAVNRDKDRAFLGLPILQSTLASN